MIQVEMRYNFEQHLRLVSIPEEKYTRILYITILESSISHIYNNVNGILQEMKTFYGKKIIIRKMIKFIKKSDAIHLLILRLLFFNIKYSNTLYFQ